MLTNLPAAGNRNNNGDQNNRGNNGNYWSSTPNGNNGYARNLNFNDGNVNMNNNNRANGFSVRCVQDLQLYLFYFLLHYGYLRKDKRNSDLC